VKQPKQNTKGRIVNGMLAPDEMLAVDEVLVVDGTLASD
jgi:hypothetical protein